MRRLIGLMSGTSLDGLDVCLATFRYGPVGLEATVEGFLTLPYPPELRSRVERVIHAGSLSLQDFGGLDVSLGRWFAEGVEAILARSGRRADEIDAVASHGQTLWHAPNGETPFSLQLGQSAEIAVRTGITTIHDFRVADVAAGGQGAPLVPAADRALFADRERPVLLLNIGGMANVTALGPGGRELVAFDTGPGIVALDQVIRDSTAGQELFDRDGGRALAGQVEHALLERWMEEPFLALEPPRSTGREHFGIEWARARHEDARQMGLSLEDTLATLAAFTVESITRSVRRFVPGDLQPQLVWVAGGGVHHGALMQGLRRGFDGISVASLAGRGVDPDAREALAFAWMGHQVLEGAPNQARAGTGAHIDVILGKITPGRDFGGIRRAPWVAGRGERVTEALHPGLEDLAQAPLEDAIVAMAREDERALAALRLAATDLAAVIGAAVRALGRGGRLIYVGAGTSGRLGVLDAVECPPTFSTDPDRVIGIMAGGPPALTGAVEGAEDDDGAGGRAMEEAEVGPRDCVVGLAASGSTPYVWGALRSAHARGADTALIACNPVEPDPAIRHLVELVVGPEAIAGSTRLRSGTVTKLALNTISTLVWARLGKTFRNRMVDVRATNHKLRERALRLVLDITGVDEEAGRTALLGADGEVKRAIVMVRRNVSAVEASRMLSEVSGHLGQIDGVV